jgi:hypothetical protein
MSDIIYKNDNETYKERCAKLIMKTWYDEYFGYPFKFDNYDDIGYCFIDYPIVTNYIKINNKKYNNMINIDDSITQTWSYIGGYATNQSAQITDFIDEYNKNEELPFIVDIVLCNKNRPCIFIFLNTKENEEKIIFFKNILSRYNNINIKKLLITIEPEWILSLKDKPDELKYDIINL